MIIDIPLTILITLAMSTLSLIGVLFIIWWMRRNVRLLISILGTVFTSDDIEEKIERTLAEKEGNRTFQKHMEKHYGEKTKRRR